MATKDRKVAASAGAAARNGGGPNGRRRRWMGDGGGGGGRQHPIIQAYPALLPLPIHAAPHTRATGACALPLPPPVLVYLQPPPPLFPKAAACYGKPNGGAPPQRGDTWRSKKQPPPPHAVTAALLPLPQGKALSFSFQFCSQHVFLNSILYWFILLLAVSAVAFLINVCYH